MTTAFGPHFRLNGRTSPAHYAQHRTFVLDFEFRKLTTKEKKKLEFIRNSALIFCTSAFAFFKMTT